MNVHSEVATSFHLVGVKANTSVTDMIELQGYKYGIYSIVLVSLWLLIQLNAIKYQVLDES